MIERIENALNQKAILLSYEKKVREVILEEKSPSPGLKSVKIDGLPLNALIFTFDGSDTKLGNQFLNSTAPDINKGCDAVILYEEDEKLCAIFCEMKSLKPSPSDYERQLLNAEIFLEYLCKLVSSVEQTPITVERKRHVLFHLKEHVSVKKGTVRTTPPLPECEFVEMTLSSSMQHVNKIYFRAASGKVIHNRIVSFENLWRSR